MSELHVKQCYPYDVKSLAISSRRKRAWWPLDVAGPFCSYPKSKYADVTRGGRGCALVNAVSNLLCLPCTLDLTDRVFKLRVVVPVEAQQRLIASEYQRNTEV